MQRRWLVGGAAGAAFVLIVAGGTVLLQYVQQREEMAHVRHVAAEQKKLQMELAAHEQRLRIVMTAIRRKAEEDRALHLSIAVDSGAMYLSQAGAVLRAMPVHVASDVRGNVPPGAHTIRRVANDTITLSGGTRIYADSTNDRLDDSLGVHAGGVRARATDLNAIQPVLVPGMTVYLYTGSQAVVSDTVLPSSKPYIVVSINEHRLWYREDDHTIFTTRVATGSGKELVQSAVGQAHWKFETPRGRLVVESKETDPEWIPPDWHYIELAQKKHLGVVHLNRKQTIKLPGGAKIAVVNNDVVTQYPDGHVEPFEVTEGHEIVVNKNVIVPPYGANQRKYTGTLGVNRLYLGDGYGIHGTDDPGSIGQSASHGCVRVRNEDIETLFRMVPIGTVVYIY